ncbi:MAG: hypothetical protein U0Z44_11185 [Kouleothrix sp.]
MVALAESALAAVVAPAGASAGASEARPPRAGRHRHAGHPARPGLAGPGHAGSSGCCATGAWRLAPLLERLRGADGAWSTPPRTRAPVLRGDRPADRVVRRLRRAERLAGWLGRHGLGPVCTGRLGCRQCAPAASIFHHTHAIYPDKPWQRPEVPLVGSFLADIEAARTGIELASFDFDLGVLTDALVRAQRRGVAVRVVIDSENLVTPAVSAQAGLLEQAGVAVRFDRRESHSSATSLRDDAGDYWLGSWNMTENDLTATITTCCGSPAGGSRPAILHRFEQLFAGRFGTVRPAAHLARRAARRGQGRGVFFARMAWPSVLERLRAARRSIQRQRFSYRQPDRAAMIERAQAGVLVSNGRSAERPATRPHSGPLRSTPGLT